MTYSVRVPWVSTTLMHTDVVAELGVKHLKAVLYGFSSESLLFGGSYEVDKWVDEAGIFWAEGWQAVNLLTVI